MDLSVIIVSWNSKEFLHRCLSSIERTSRGITCEAIVIDNASRDGSADYIRDHFPNIKLIELSHNTGFAHACNIGIKESRARYCCFLNPDTELLNNSLSHLVRFLDDHPSAAIAGGKILNPDQTEQLSIRKFPTPLIALGVTLKFHHLPIFKKWIKGDYGVKADMSKTQLTDFVSGAFFISRKSFLDQIEGFDERFFLWFEEVDLMKQAQSKGWDVYYYPNATVLHWGGRSFAKVMSLQNQKQFLSSMTKYIKKWHGASSIIPLLLLNPIVLIFYRIFRLKNRNGYKK